MRKLAIAFVLCIAVISMCIVAAIAMLDESWSLDEIQHYLGVQLPKDAQNLTYSSGTNRYVHVELNFKASPSTALSFTSHFCDGVLHQGYDPFNAINVNEQVQGSFKIDLIDYYTRSYYSYSPRTSQLKAGVFCYLYDGLFWVLVDQSDPALYTVKFKHLGDRIGIHADVKPVADFPIMARGLTPELGGGYSALDPVCLDLDPDAMDRPDKKWSSLIGVDVQVLIDGKEMTGAFVSNEGRLARKDGKNNYSNPDSNLFKYCLLMWKSGLHTISIKIPSGIGSKDTYSWIVRGDGSASCEHNHPDNDCYGSFRPAINRTG